MEAHEYCLLFPNMSPEEFAELGRDIAKNGLIDPVITYKGEILDGRHRHKACGLLGITPKYEEWNGQCGTILAFVVSRNLHRRSLKPGQRAAIALDVKAKLEVEYRERMAAGGRARAKTAKDGLSKNVQPIPRGGDSTAEAAEMMGVGRSYVADAKRIREKSTDVFNEVKLGKKTIPQAKRELSEKSKPTQEPMLSFETDELAVSPMTELAEKWIGQLGVMKREFKCFADAGDVLSRIDSLISSLKVASV